MRILATNVPNYTGKKVCVSGWIHKIRKLGGIAFLVIRDRTGLVQCVCEDKKSLEALSNLSNESVVSIIGKVVQEDRAVGGAEIHVTNVELISRVSEDVPVEINKLDMGINLDTLLDYRQVSLRNLKQRAIFKIHDIVTSSFREYFSQNDFTEINTPKIVEEGLETGGAEMFSLKWFGKNVFLAQSPQMYKQIMVGVFERVFEISPQFRAEKHSTTRHVNELLMMDFEMGFIEGWEDIIDMSEGYVHRLVDELGKRSKEELNLWKAALPLAPKKIPRMMLTEAQEIIKKEFNHDIIGEPDLDPEGERLISAYALKNLKSDFIFITHYPSKKRAFYSKDDPDNPTKTLTFDLLFRGVEINSGGERIHKYEDYIQKMKERGLDPKGFEDYLAAFRFGMPKHGGTGWGSARITEKILGLDNVREAILFPRDINRLRP